MEADVVVWSGCKGTGKSYLALRTVNDYLSLPSFHVRIWRNSLIASSGDDVGTWKDMKQSIHGHEYKYIYTITRNRGKEHASSVRLQSMGVTNKASVSNAGLNGVALMVFDELGKVNGAEFLSLMGEMRPIGYKAKTICTMNPDPYGWVKSFLAPWADRTHPLFPYPHGKSLSWEHFGDELEFKHAEVGVYDLTMTFHEFEEEDAPEEMRENIRRQKASKLEWERRALFENNWDAMLDKGGVFDVDKIKIWGREYNPLHKARGIDYAVTSSHQPGRPGDYTSYVIIGKTRDEDYVIEKVFRGKIPAGRAEEWTVQIAHEDEMAATVFEEEPGAQARIAKEHLVRSIVSEGLKWHVMRIGSKTKAERARFLALAVEQGRVFVLPELIDHRIWRQFTEELSSFPLGRHDDMVDAASLAFNSLSAGRIPYSQ